MPQTSNKTAKRPREVDSAISEMRPKSAQIAVTARREMPILGIIRRRQDVLRKIRNPRRNISQKERRPKTSNVTAKRFREVGFCNLRNAAEIAPNRGNWAPQNAHFGNPKETSGYFAGNQKPAKNRRNISQAERLPKTSNKTAKRLREVGFRRSRKRGRKWAKSR